MNTGISQARQTRTQHRHELRTLTYLTMDEANGGVVRNLSRQGMGAQVVSAVHPRQQLRIRFELRYPKLRVETKGEVVWATFSGQCGIRFIDLPPEIGLRINEWIFGDLLERVSLHADPAESIFAAKQPLTEDSVAKAEQDDGLMVSAAPLKVIPIVDRKSATTDDSPFLRAIASKRAFAVHDRESEWLSQPLSRQGLAWAIHTLVVLAGILLFVLVFLAITREAPEWPLAMATVAVVVVAGMYWSFFQIFGGSTLGARLARMAEVEGEDEEKSPRFR